MNSSFTLIFLTVFTFLFGLGAEAGSQIHNDSIPALDSISLVHPKVDSILFEAKKQIGTPYGYGSNSTKRFDCSGLTRHCYSKVGVELPHSSAAQAKLGEKIKLKDAQSGDLIFFKGRSTKGKNIGHVAIVVSNEGGEIRMIHATSRGVIIDHYNSSEYYTKRFVEVRRIIN